MKLEENVISLLFYLRKDLSIYNNNLYFSSRLKEEEAFLDFFKISIASSFIVNKVGKKVYNLLFYINKFIRY